MYESINVSIEEYSNKFILVPSWLGDRKTTRLAKDVDSYIASKELVKLSLKESFACEYPDIESERSPGINRTTSYSIYLNNKIINGTLTKDCVRII